MKKLFCILICLMVGIFFAGGLIAAEHPGEHPGTPAKQKEHPGKTPEHPGEHPGEKEMCCMLTAGEIIEAIKSHIAKVTKGNNGVYPLRDDKEGKGLKLKLVRVHEDRVSYIKKDDAYFACSDFVTEDGKTKYDVDFWMKKTSKGALEVYQTKIHKKDGIPRFTYQDDEISPVNGKKAPEKGTTPRRSPEKGT